LTTYIVFLASSLNYKRTLISPNIYLWKSKKRPRENRRNALHRRRRRDFERSKAYNLAKTSKLTAHMCVEPRFFSPIIYSSSMSHNEFRSLNITSLKFRMSLRWVDIGHIPYTCYFLPYIDQTGFSSGIAAYQFSVDPRVVVATMYSTMLFRILSYIRKIFTWREVIDLLDCARAVAVTSLLVNDISIHRRLISILSQKKKEILNILSSQFAQNWARMKGLFYAMSGNRLNGLVSVRVNAYVYPRIEFTTLSSI